MTFGDFTRSSSGQDVQGAALIGGKMNLGGSFSFMNSPGTATKGFGGINGTGDPDLVVYGGVNLTGGNSGQVLLNGGTAAVNLAASPTTATWNSIDKTVTQGSSSVAFLNQGSTSPQTLYNNWISSGSYNLTYAQNWFKGGSVTMKNTANQNVTSSGGSNQINLSVSASSIGVWNINQSALSSINEIALNVPSTSLLVINVHGAAGGTFPSANSIGGTSSNASRVIWNITNTASGGDEWGASTFNYTVGNGGNTIWGSFLAPKANINAQAVIEGQVVAQSWTQGGVELHTEMFMAPLAIIPEPTAVSALLGAAALVLACRRPRGSVRD